MAHEAEADWPQCGQCIGVALEGTTHCWAHASQEEFEGALRKLGGDGYLDARGVTFPEGLLKKILSAAPQNDEANVVLSDADFGRATFHGEADFSRVFFEGSTTLFEEATFKGGARFGEASFHGDARFQWASFQDLAWFDGDFHGDAEFAGVSFQGLAWFVGAMFHGTARFGRAKFQRDARFELASFHNLAWFDLTDFNGGTAFEGASFQGTPGSTRRSLSRPDSLGPCLCKAGLISATLCFENAPRSLSAPLSWCAVVSSSLQVCTCASGGRM